jgi:hypothetical protein
VRRRFVLDHADERTVLWAENNTDRGASFHFTLPVAEPVED